MVKRFRECASWYERHRPILCLTPGEVDRISQLAEVDGVSFSDEIQAILTDWLAEDAEQLAEMKGRHSYPDRTGIAQ